MSSRVIAAAVAIAMLLPAAARAGVAACDADVLIKGHCCCDDGAEVEATAPTIEGTCCCDFDRPPADVPARHALVLSDGHDLPAAALVRASWRAERPPTSTPAPPHRARGPPAHTLLSQRTLLLC